MDDAALRALAGAVPGLEEARPEPETFSAEDAEARRLIGLLAAGGLLRRLVPAPHGGDHETVSCAAVAILREALAFRSGFADAMFVMQGLGTAAIALRGSEAQRAAWLPPVASGRSIAAFALTEPGAGSDVLSIATTARRDGDGYLLDGTKTFISNAGIADLHTLVARTSGDRRRGLSMFVVVSSDPGFGPVERLRAIAPHPLGTIHLRGCRIPAGRRIGEEGDGLAIALEVLNRYRPTVGAAAVGFARRALREAIRHVTGRRQFGAPLADLQGIRCRLADLATAVEAAALLVRRAAEAVDAGHPRTALFASMAKLRATETAGEVADAAVQMLGGLGVLHGGAVERIYREVRALRIYEGASEVQRNLIAREILRRGGGA